MNKHIADFLDFVREQGVIGLAVAFILGGAISKVVAALVSDLVNPVIGIFLGAAGDLSSYSLKVGSAHILWGHFVSVLIDFLVVATVVYLGVKKLGFDKLDKKKQ